MERTVWHGWIYSSINSKKEVIDGIINVVMKEIIMRIIDEEFIRNKEKSIAKTKRCDIILPIEKTKNDNKDKINNVIS